MEEIDQVGGEIGMLNYPREETPATTGLPRSVYKVLILVAYDPLAAETDDRMKMIHRREVRALVGEGFESIELPWLPADRDFLEDRGGSILLMLPPSVGTIERFESLIVQLAADLRTYRELASDGARFRLRIAHGSGLVHHDHIGVIGQAIDELYDLVDAERFRSQLDKTGSDLGVILSNQAYRDLQTGARLLKPREFASLVVGGAQDCEQSWVYLSEGHEVAADTFQAA